MKLNTDEPGLYALFKPHEAEILKQLWKVARSHKNAKGSAYIYQWLVANAHKIGITYKSRATVINFLNRLVDEGVLGWKDATGKGGHHRLYYVKRNRANFENYARKTIAAKLDEIFEDINDDT